MWLKLVIVDKKEGGKKSGSIIYKVVVSDELVAPVGDEIDYRLSPIFPLIPQAKFTKIKSTNIHFFNFPNAFRTLGRVEKKGSKSLKAATFFSIGLSSIILITNKEKLIAEFMGLITSKEKAYEKWAITDNLIKSSNQAIHKHLVNLVEFKNKIETYIDLPITDRALIDEFYITINLLLPKLTAHMPSEEVKINRLIDEVNYLVKELVYLNNPKGKPPKKLKEYSKSQLEQKALNLIVKNQNLDRIIQINSALSYISTQAFSGAVPILERRSLIRRYSLLGVGSAILALNNIARFIERSFSQLSFYEIIVNSMAKAPALSFGNNIIYYDSREWRKSSVDVFASAPETQVPYYKLPYFSGRLGFRETEYSIAAAIQSITSGASPEWSLMTVTHEMLHGHVRNILSLIFFGDDNMNRTDQRKVFYEKLEAQLLRKAEDFNLIDSIRNLILSYCCVTIQHGSLSVTSEYKAKFEVILPEKDDLWRVFESENRNINEIFVHVLDLHYFYAGRVSIYIPLIWRSWIAVPHIAGDLNQYILRSLLAIASKENSGDSFTRFRASISIFERLLSEHKNGKLDFPIVAIILSILSDKSQCDKLFPAFKSSLIIVDIAAHIFISTKIRSHLFNDGFVKWKNDDRGIEEEFSYQLPNGFNDENIASPLAYLLDRMIKEFNSKEGTPDLERETAIQFLALNSQDEN